MTITSIIFWILVPLVTVFQFYNHWCLSHGRLNISYRISMFSYTVYFIIECMLAFRDPEQLPLLIFNILNVWAFVMAIKGYLRLKREKNGDPLHKV